MANWFRTLAGDRPPPEGLAEWAEQQPSFAEAWSACERPDWLAWMAARMPLSEESQRVLVRAAALCARPRRSLLQLYLVRPPSFLPTALEVAQVWGKKGTIDALQRSDENTIAVWNAAWLAGAAALAVELRLAPLWLRFASMYVVFFATFFVVLAPLALLRRRWLRRRVAGLDFERGIEIVLQALRRKAAHADAARLRRMADEVRVNVDFATHLKAI